VEPLYKGLASLGEPALEPRARVSVFLYFVERAPPGGGRASEPQTAHQSVEPALHQQHYVVERHRSCIVLSDSLNAISHADDVMPTSLGALVNVAVFLPLGWLGYHVGRRLALRRPARILLVVLAGAALSLTIELAQSVVANRHAPRWSFLTRHGGDIALNVLGVALGALAAAARRRA